MKKAKNGKILPEVIDMVSRERLSEYLWHLVNIPSPTRQERRAAMRFAEMLEQAGATVEIDETLPESPNVVGRLKGKQPGKVLQLAGHIDHIDIPHAKPQRSETLISGRGSADMKCGLAGILEIVRLLTVLGCDFPGELLVTVYGLHEAPIGDSQGLLNLIKGRIVGDAALVFEGPRDQAVVMGKGQSIWNTVISREGEICHELWRSPEADCLLGTVISLTETLQRKCIRLSHEEHIFPLLGPQSVFIGQLHYGDFYNRMPKEAFLQGTWRWHPDHRFAQVKQELRELIAEVNRPLGVKIEDSWIFVGESYRIDKKDPIVLSLRDSYCRLFGREMGIAGTSLILDAGRLVSLGEIPAVPLGFDLATAHADYEFVHLDRVEEGCRLGLLTVLTYLTEDFQNDHE